MIPNGTEWSQRSISDFNTDLRVIQSYLNVLTCVKQLCKFSPGSKTTYAHTNIPAHPPPWQIPQ